MENHGYFFLSVPHYGQGAVRVHERLGNSRCWSGRWSSGRRTVWGHKPLDRSSTHSRGLRFVYKPLYIADGVRPGTMSPCRVTSHLGHMVVKQVAVKANPA